MAEQNVLAGAMFWREQCFGGSNVLAEQCLQPAFAEQLGHRNVAKLLQQTLEEAPPMKNCRPLPVDEVLPGRTWWQRGMPK